MKILMRALSAFTVTLWILTFAAPAHSAHWDPPGWWPGPYGHTVWGELTGFCSGLDDPESQVAAFRVSSGALVGLSSITVSGGFWYNMVIHALNTTSFQVYFRVWDGTSEWSTSPNFTASPDSPPPETQHNLSAEGAVPEPSSIIMLVISFGSAIFFRRRRRSSPVQQ